MDGCIEYRGDRDNKGYGRMFVNGKRIKAHRLALALHLGVAVEGLGMVLHKCGNPACVNPAHLYCGTHSENAADSIRHGTMRRGEQHSNSKLTVAQVAAIRKHLDEGVLTYRQIIEALGLRITPEAISQIKCGRAWKWTRENTTTNCTAP